MVSIGLIQFDSAEPDCGRKPAELGNAMSDTTHLEACIERVVLHPLQPNGIAQLHLRSADAEQAAAQGLRWTSVNAALAAVSAAAAVRSAGRSRRSSGCTRARTPFDPLKSVVSQAEASSPRCRWALAPGLHRASDRRCAQRHLRQRCAWQIRTHERSCRRRTFQRPASPRH